MKRKPLAVSLLISLGTGVIAGFLTSGSMEKYQEMYRPPLSPPGWVFPIVWLILYTLMGIAAYRIYMKNPKAESLKLYLIQLAVNFLWPIIFFQSGMAAICSSMDSAVMVSGIRSDKRVCQN